MGGFANISPIISNNPNMPQLNATSPHVVNQGGNTNVSVQGHLKQQLEEARKKVDQLEAEIGELESAS
jgi:hypothetical protein